MREIHVDVVVIGAGASGLVVLRELDRAGVSVLGVEARDRIGGRILTVHDPRSPMPIELGAEFVHGRPPEIFDATSSAALAVYDAGSEALQIDTRTGQMRSDDELSDDFEQVMADLVKAGEHERDCAFADWLKKTTYAHEVKRRATSFVEGFNAARKEVIGIASLSLDGRASEEIGADQNYRIAKGYDALMRHLLEGVKDAGKKLRLNQVVEHVEWKEGAATIRMRSTLTGEIAQIYCRKVVVTVPLGVLQADAAAYGAIRFSPEPKPILDSAKQLSFGQVVRIVLRFREAFWESKQELREASFLLSQEPLFPVWWTTLPMRTSIITGWSAGPNADSLLEKEQPEIIEAALASLSRITQFPQSRLSDLLEGAYLHRWDKDPFARGAYSYVPANAMEARKSLTEPVQDTLYFAGEATEITGHGGTVNGAMASGARAAAQLLGKLQKA